MNIRKFWHTAETVTEDAWEAFAGDAPSFVRALADEVTALRSTIEQLYQAVHGTPEAPQVEPPVPVTPGADPSASPGPTAAAAGDAAPGGPF